MKLEAYDIKKSLLNIIAAFICCEQEKIKRLKARHGKGSNGQVSFNDMEKHRTELKVCV